MSKTKEEILQHHYIHGKGLTHPEYVQKAMDEYAAQVLSEYKEKLIASQIPYPEPSGIAAIGVPEYGENPVRVTFGLRPEQIAFIEEMAEKLGGVQSDWLWKDVGEKIGWHPHAACSYYADCLRDKLKAVSPPPQAESEEILNILNGSGSAQERLFEIRELVEGRLKI